jgi:hypothetical protein
MATDPNRIWLGPECEDYDPAGRQWSGQPNDCGECNTSAVEYVRADVVRALVSRAISGSNFHDELEAVLLALRN